MFLARSSWSLERSSHNESFIRITSSASFSPALLLMSRFHILGATLPSGFRLLSLDFGLLSRLVKRAHLHRHLFHSGLQHLHLRKGRLHERQRLSRILLASLNGTGCPRRLLPDALLVALCGDFLHKHNCTASRAESLSLVLFRLLLHGIPELLLILQTPSLDQSNHHAEAHGLLIGCPRALNAFGMDQIRAEAQQDVWFHLQQTEQFTFGDNWAAIHLEAGDLLLFNAQLLQLRQIMPVAGHRR